MTTSALTSEDRAVAEKAVNARVLQNFVGGRWIAAQASGRLDLTNPANGEVLARVPLSGHDDVEAAVSAASTALPDWRARPVGDRTQYIYALREQFLKRIDELAASITREGGKVLSDARAEVTRAIEVLEVACASPMTMQGRVLEGVARGIDTETVRQSIGVCAAITPFNFPAMVPMWFLPFAIVCGNTFILKPSEQVPLTSELIGRILTDIGGRGKNRFERLGQRIWQCRPTLHGGVCAGDRRCGAESNYGAPERRGTKADCRRRNQSKGRARSRDFDRGL